MSFPKAEELPKELFDLIEQMEAEAKAKEAEEERRLRMLKVGWGMGGSRATHVGDKDTQRGCNTHLSRPMSWAPLASRTPRWTSTFTRPKTPRQSRRRWSWTALCLIVTFCSRCLPRPSSSESERSLDVQVSIFTPAHD